ncbi:TD and POZ domain-containing protein 4 [Araneus ventricosus]|uniref:TD and POZ domain-containing protein 4 n=1 Tax=Araneus ventricosus TaxID=182803 RepID=A0A4Y2D7N3_ARAVE|nr:TD and POZ domain-containing protein 4 [Araneus ventricosus]
MACKDSGKKCFTFIWKIENASYCLQKKSERIKSSAFVVDELEETKWKLWLYPRGDKHGNYISYYLNREEDSKGASSIKILYQLAFISKNASVPESSDVVEDTFSKDDGFGYDKFVKRENVFLTKNSKFLPQDTLTAVCRIWKSVGELTQDVYVFARTRIGIEKRFFEWKLDKFSRLDSEEKRTYIIKSLASGRHLMFLNMFVTGGQTFEEKVHFEFILQDQTIKFSTVRLFLIDASGNRVKCNREEFWFNNLAKYKQISFLYTRKQLMADKSLYLPDDTLSLQWEWVFSRGIVLEEIEAVQHACTSFESDFSDSTKGMNNDKMVPLSHTLNNNLKSLYDEQFFCDIKLKTRTSIFPAHKVILSASSSVFKAMFLSDMKEKNSDCIDMQDLSDDTVRRMLLFTYTTRVEDLSWESASLLYVAADKYAILSLMNICSSYLKDNLSPSNACDILLLSDFHVDGDLKYAVQMYILKHGKQITNSNEWKVLLQTNAKLAAETLCLVLK